MEDDPRDLVAGLVRVSRRKIATFVGECSQVLTTGNGAEEPLALRRLAARWVVASVAGDTTRSVAALIVVGAMISLVDSDRHEPPRCDEALTRVFGLLGKRWSGMVLGVLLERPARFAEIARAIPTMTEGMLSARLSELQEAGLIEREVFAGPPIASVYRLTEEGAALRPALLALGEWASKYMPAASRSLASR